MGNLRLLCTALQWAAFGQSPAYVTTVLDAVCRSTAIGRGSPPQMPTVRNGGASFLKGTTACLVQVGHAHYGAPGTSDTQISGRQIQYGIVFNISVDFSSGSQGAK